MYIFYIFIKKKIHGGNIIWYNVYTFLFLKKKL